MTHNNTYPLFTREMRDTHTILVPNMLPNHFKLIISVFRTFGYRMELVEEEGPAIAETGLKYTHNDACYPAVLVVGQFMHALQSGRYDPDKTAVIMFQTGGGCRASNYVSLIRKALIRGGMPQVPVIGFGFAGLEHHPGFKLTPRLIYGLMYAVLCGDLLMSLQHQVEPYEQTHGAAAALAADWTQRLAQELGAGGHISHRRMLQRYREMVQDFAALPVTKRDAVKVGIVGEIFVKYSPLANNGLERFLVQEGAEAVVPGLTDFLMYCVWNSIMDTRLYGRKALVYPFAQAGYHFLNRRREELSRVLKESGRFAGWTPFPEVVRMPEGYISEGVKMGEGWLLTAEMLELAASGCRNIVCAQPFGCLPNHICGKGMMKPIKERNPDVNIVAIDYDPGASRVNQENRLRLMLANARRGEA